MNDLRAAVEAAFTEAVNAPSSVVPGLAVPYYRDVENIWRAIDAALSPHRCIPDEAALAEALQTQIALDDDWAKKMAARIIARLQVKP